MKNEDKEYISINRKIILSFSIPILILILIFYIIINIIFKLKFNDYVEYKQENTLEKVAINIHKSYIEGKWNTSNLSELGDELLEDGIILEILDEEEKIIFSMIKENEVKCKNVFLEIVDNMKEIKPMWVGKIINNKTPIYNDKNDLIGYKVLIYYDQIVYMAEEILFVIWINKILVVLAIISLLTVLLITIVVSRHISYPIKRVSQITKFIGEGNYKTLDYDGNIYELNNLIHSINNLSSSLESQEHLRGQLITDLSHELANPMTSIHGHLRAIIDGIWDPSVERLTSIDNELLRIIDLIEKLKNLDKIEKEPLHMEKANLKMIITSVINNVEASALAKNISIEYELKEIYAYVDRNKISQVILNIVSNAVKYSDNNGKISIKLYSIKNNVCIEVNDWGRGIPKEDLPYVFERFYRVEKSKSDNSEGLGIGLTISRLLVKEHGGEIMVSSEENKGSKFTIVLPISLYL